MGMISEASDKYRMPRYIPIEIFNVPASKKDETSPIKSMQFP